MKLTFKDTNAHIPLITKSMQTVSHLSFTTVPVFGE